MFTILSTMFLGIVLGYFFRHLKFLQKTEKTISMTIPALLFILGMSVGSNKLIINNFGTFGYQALILAFLSLTGSLIATALVIRIFSKGGKK